MVRLSSKRNKDILGSLVIGFFSFQRNHTFIKNINFPDVGPCIFALWHGNQCSIFGIPDELKGRTNIMISNSADGQIVAAGVESLGFKVVRGSTGRKGSVSGTMQLINALKTGEYGAIMVDGPRGPKHKAKGGIVKIAKTANIPIVPMCWYSDQFNLVQFNSWDNMTVPFHNCNLINLYGEPIYVNPNAPDDEDNRIIEKIQASLEDLDRRIPQVFQEAKKNKLWKKK